MDEFTLAIVLGCATIVAILVALLGRYIGRKKDEWAQEAEMLGLEGAISKMDSLVAKYVASGWEVTGGDWKMVRLGRYTRTGHEHIWIYIDQDYEIRAFIEKENDEHAREIKEI